MKCGNAIGRSFFPDSLCPWLTTMIGYDIQLIKEHIKAQIYTDRYGLILEVY